MNSKEYEKENIGKALLYDELYPKTALALPFGTLIQVAEVALIRGSEITEHTQRCDEITYAISGKATFYVDGKPTVVRAGDLHFVRSGLTHRIVTGYDENFRYVCIGYTPKPNYKPLSPYLTKTANIDSITVLDNGKAKQIFELLVDEMYTVDPEQDMMLNLYVTQLLTTFYRILNGNIAPKRVNRASSSFTVYHLMRYIDNNYMTMGDIKSVADELSYSEYYLSHLFKEKLGIGIKEYITIKKLSAAAEMLIGDGLPVNDVAEKLGYTSVHTFRQAFKRYFGLSPSEYVKDINQKKTEQLSTQNR